MASPKNVPHGLQSEDWRAVRVRQPATTATARAAAAFCFSVETAMRAGEIVGLTPASVVGAVVQYWFGSSAGSAQKTALLAQQEPRP